MRDARVDDGDGDAVGACTCVWRPSADGAQLLLCARCRCRRRSRRGYVYYYHYHYYCVGIIMIKTKRARRRATSAGDRARAAWRACARQNDLTRANAAAVRYGGRPTRPTRKRVFPAVTRTRPPPVRLAWRCTRCRRHRAPIDKKSAGRPPAYGRRAARCRLGHGDEIDYRAALPVKSNPAADTGVCETPLPNSRHSFGPSDTIFNPPPSRPPPHDRCSNGGGGRVTHTNRFRTTRNFLGAVK